MAGYIVVQVDVTDPAGYEIYKAMVEPSITHYGGRYLARGGNVGILEGTWNPKRFVILEFPTTERAREWWNSPEYSDAKKKRQSASHTEMIVVEGV
jgi:uncharacterized protein (DUF1330 family)